MSNGGTELDDRQTCPPSPSTTFARASAPSKSSRACRSRRTTATLSRSLAHRAPANPPCSAASTCWRCRIRARSASAARRSACKRTRRGMEPADQRQVDRIRSRVAMVFQSFNLWSHMTILENVIEAPIHVQKRPRAECIAEAEAMLAEGRHRRQAQPVSVAPVGRAAAARRHRAGARHATRR